LEAITERLNANNYIDGREDIAFLLEAIHSRDRKLKVLAQQALELSQEIENVKSDFGGDAR
jgi:hypothetical protein